MNKNDVIFFTGAGISADSGIPTFEEQNSIRDKLTREYADENPIGYMDTIMDMTRTCLKAHPSDAHEAIKKYGFKVITMNIDGLHGDTDVLELHGRIPTRIYDSSNDNDIEEFFSNDNIVLYGDVAPNYQKAVKMVKNLPYGRGFFVIVGTSFYTAISSKLLEIARKRKAHVIIINSDASKRVPEICERLNKMIEGD